MPKPEGDLDFMIENPVSEFDLPYGWRVGNIRFGNPKLVNGKKEIDYILLRNINSILQRQVEPTIENYLTRVPLIIQSIAYDFYESKFFGETGIDALQRRVVEVNNLLFAERYTQKKNKSLQTMIKEKSDGLGFTPIFPESEF